MIRSLLTCSQVGIFIVFQAVSLVVNFFPSWMGLANVVVKLSVHKHLVAGRTTEIVWLHVLLLQVASHEIKATYNSSTNETHESIGQLLHLCLHH